MSAARTPSISPKRRRNNGKGAASAVASASASVDSIGPSTNISWEPTPWEQQWQEDPRSSDSSYLHNAGSSQQSNFSLPHVAASPTKARAGGKVGPRQQRGAGARGAASTKRGRGRGRARARGRGREKTKQKQAKSESISSRSAPDAAAFFPHPKFSVDRYKERLASVYGNGRPAKGISVAGLDEKKPEAPLPADADGVMYSDIVDLTEFCRAAGVDPDEIQPFGPEGRSVPKQNDLQSHNGDQGTSGQDRESQPQNGRKLRSKESTTRRSPRRSQRKQRKRSSPKKQHRAANNSFSSSGSGDKLNFERRSGVSGGPASFDGEFGFSAPNDQYLRSSSAPQGKPAGPRNLVQQLQSLAELYEKDLVTDQEYAASKTAILASLSQSTQQVPDSGRSSATTSGLAAVRLPTVPLKNVARAIDVHEVGLTPFTSTYLQPDEEKTSGASPGRTTGTAWSVEILPRTEVAIQRTDGAGHDFWSVSLVDVRLPVPSSRVFAFQVRASTRIWPHRSPSVSARDLLRSDGARNDPAGSRGVRTRDMNVKLEPDLPTLDRVFAQSPSIQQRLATFSQTTEHYFLVGVHKLTDLASNQASLPFSLLEAVTQLLRSEHNEGRLCWSSPDDIFIDADAVELGTKSESAPVPAFSKVALESLLSEKRATEASKEQGTLADEAPHGAQTDRSQASSASDGTHRVERPSFLAARAELEAAEKDRVRQLAPESFPKLMSDNRGKGVATSNSTVIASPTIDGSPDVPEQEDMGELEGYLSEEDAENKSVQTEAESEAEAYRYVEKLYTDVTIDSESRAQSETAEGNNAGPEKPMSTMKAHHEHANAAGASFKAEGQPQTAIKKQAAGADDAPISNDAGGSGNEADNSNDVGNAASVPLSPVPAHSPLRRSVGQPDDSERDAISDGGCDGMSASLDEVSSGHNSAAISESILLQPQHLQFTQNPSSRASYYARSNHALRVAAEAHASGKGYAPSPRSRQHRRQRSKDTEGIPVVEKLEIDTNHKYTNSGASGSDASTDSVLPIGIRVEANFEGQGQWFVGKIVKFNEARQTYQVEYDDGDLESGVPRQDLRILDESDEVSNSIFHRLPVPGEWIAVAHILLQHTGVSPSMLYPRPPGSPLLPSFEAVMRRMMDWKKSIAATHPLKNRLLQFKILADKFSECPNSARLGGFLGELCIKSAHEVSSGATGGIPGPDGFVGTGMAGGVGSTGRHQQMQSTSPIDKVITTLRIGQISFPTSTARGLHLVIRLPAVQRYPRGAFIEALYDPGGKASAWLPGVVTRYDADSGCYDVLFNDGEEGAGLESIHIRRRKYVAPDSPSGARDQRSVSTHDPNKLRLAFKTFESPRKFFPVGAEVEAKYGGEAWYPARIIGLRREQVVDVKVGSRWIKQKKEVVSPSAKVTSYDVVYTDGSLEERVSVDEVRPIIDRKDFIAHQAARKLLYLSSPEMKNREARAATRIQRLSRQVMTQRRIVNSQERLALWRGLQMADAQRLQRQEKDGLRKVETALDVVEDSLDDNGYPETSNDENQRRRLRTASKSFRNMGSKRERRSLPARSPKVASRDSSEPGREDSVSPLAIAADHVAHMTGLDEESESYYDDTPRSDGQQNRVADRDLLTKLARNARDRKGTIGDREESFIHRRISYALQELEDVLSSQDGQEILRAEAKLRWAFDHNAIQEVTFSRASKMAPIGAKFVFPQHIAAHQHFNDCDSFAVLDFVASDSVLAGSELQLGDAVVSVNGNPFNSREKFVALLYEESDVTLQTVRLDEVPSDEDYLSLARSAMLSRISSTTSMRAKVVFAWQTFARSDEQVAQVVKVQRQYRRRAARKKALLEVAMRGGSHSGSVKLQRLTALAHQSISKKQSRNFQ